VGCGHRVGRSSCFPGIAVSRRVDPAPDPGAGDATGDAGARWTTRVTGPTRSGWTPTPSEPTDPPTDMRSPRSMHPGSHATRPSRTRTGPRDGSRAGIRARWIDRLWRVTLKGSRCEGQLMDESETPAEPADAGASAPPETASVIMAAFEDSHAAERMVASLGHDLRHQARKGDAKAFVVSRHRDGSFKLVQSRVLTAGGLGAAAIGFMTATMAGLRGAGAVFRGAKTVTRPRATIACAAGRSAARGDSRSGGSALRGPADPLPG
jgi:hypothetical protein